MRVVIFLCLFVTSNYIQSQCIPDSINQEFVNNQAVIGQDSVVVILTGATSKTLDGRGAHFHLISVCPKTRT